MDTNPHYIVPEQLCVGLYIHLDTGWMNHSFTFSNFEIKDEKQIQKIRSLKLDKIRYDPQRSKSKPLEIAVVSEQPTPTAAKVPVQVAPIASIEPDKNKLRLRTKRLLQLNKLIQDCKKEFTADAEMARSATRHFAHDPNQAVVNAEKIVGGLVNSMITESDVVLHAVATNSEDPESYVHALNVTVLALMLAKSIDMNETEARVLGLAALFHDVGKNELYRSKKVMLDLHCEDGARMIKAAGLSEHVAEIILQHHENADGSGTPKHLKLAQIDPLAQLVSVVNTYDNLCNPSDANEAKSPYEALAHMYSMIPERFDKELLQLFIRALGVYPPGSIVLLSNGVYGIVSTASPKTPLLPYVMVYAPNVPRKTSVILDLSEEDGLSIKKCLKPKDLPKEVFEYFSPRSRVYYYHLRSADSEAIDSKDINKSS